MKKNIFLLVLILVSAILISECNSQDYTQNNPGGEQLSNNQSDQPETPSKDYNNPAANVKDILITAMGFSPKEINVKSGTDITWTNEDTGAHVIGSEEGFFTSDSLEKGDSVSFTFNESGRYVFYSVNKPELKVTVIVE